MLLVQRKVNVIDYGVLPQTFWPVLSSRGIWLSFFYLKNVYWKSQLIPKFQRKMFCLLNLLHLYLKGWVNFWHMVGAPSILCHPLRNVLTSDRMCRTHHSKAWQRGSNAAVHLGKKRWGKKSPTSRFTIKPIHRTSLSRTGPNTYQPSIPEVLLGWYRTQRVQRQFYI